VVRNFIGRYPKVRLNLRQGTPAQIAEWGIGCGGAGADGQIDAAGRYLACCCCLTANA